MHRPSGEEIVAIMEQAFPGEVTPVDDRFATVIKVTPNVLLSVLGMLKHDYGFNYLADLTAVDYGDHFTVVYQVQSLPDRRRLVVKTDVEREQPVLPSAVGVWMAADWQEREIYDLMGIEFSGHPDLKRILLPEDFVGHPLRKDYQGVKKH